MSRKKARFFIAKNETKSAGRTCSFLSALFRKVYLKKKQKKVVLTHPSTNTMLGTGFKVAVLAAAVACYVRPQLLLLEPLLGSELDEEDADSSKHVLRGLLTLLSFGLAGGLRPSWVRVLMAVAALQLVLWGLELYEDSLMGVSVATEKDVLVAGAAACFAAVVGILLFGGKSDARDRFR